MFPVVRASDLRLRDVVNILDGAKLGVISDFDMDLESGRVRTLIIPGPKPIFGLFGRETEYVVPWEAIRKVGADVILVELPGDTDQESAR